MHGTNTTATFSKTEADPHVETNRSMQEEKTLSRADRHYSSGHCSTRQDADQHTPSKGKPDSRDSEKGRLGRRDYAGIFARVAVAAVFIINVQCAVQFIVWPHQFMSSYELSGVEGRVALQGLGVAFLMWNATYPAVIVNPRRFRSLFIVVYIQQFIGLVGESIILASLPAGHSVLTSSILRFIVFDAGGLAIMLVAFVWLTLSARKLS